MGGVDRVRNNRRLTLEDAAAFHGHKGPFVVLGYRAGIYAVETLRPETEFDLLAEIEIPIKTPYSCILDGIQCSTKCTLGKGNIIVRQAKHVRIKIRNTKSNKEVSLELNGKYIELFENLEIEKASKIAEEEDIMKLFRIVIG